MSNHCEGCWYPNILFSAGSRPPAQEQGLGCWPWTSSLITHPAGFWKKRWCLGVLLESKKDRVEFSLWVQIWDPSFRENGIGESWRLQVLRQPQWFSVSRLEWLHYNFCGRVCGRARGFIFKCPRQEQFYPQVMIIWGYLESWKNIQRTMPHPLTELPCLQENHSHSGQISCFKKSPFQRNSELLVSASLYTFPVLFFQG